MQPSIPVPERTAHPFLTHDMIRSIPAGFEATLRKMSEGDTSVPAGEIVFTGNGTSFYSALMGSQVLALTRAPWRAVQAFEFSHYEPMAGPGIVVGVSHSGITKATFDALLYAKSKGALTIGVTHFTERPISKVADRTFLIGDGPDKSRCHTKTYTDSAAAVLKLALEYTKSSGGSLGEIEDELRQGLHRKLSETVSSAESPARDSALALSSIQKIFFVGAGPNLVTAREAALKIKETSFLPAEGFELEEILHGPWVSFDKHTLIAVIAPSGASTERAKDLLSAAKNVGAKTLAVTDADLSADYVLRVSTVHEYISPFLSIIPLYYFSYYLALQLGNNPDYLRYLDPVYWEARQIVFPPGTH